MGKMNELPTGVALSVVLLCILAAVVKVSHSECEKLTRFTQTTDNITVFFSACEQSDRIRLTQLEPHGRIHHNRSHIWVHFTPRNLTSGSHIYHIRYLYDCWDPPYFCPRNGTQLHLRVADFNLKASTLQPVFGDNVTLHCFSGLSKAIDVTVNFTFQTRSKTKPITKQFVCNESEYHVGNKWWIRRTGSIPHDCILEIVGVDGSDSGMYQCIGDLRSSAAGESEDAASNTVNISVIAYEDTFSPAFVTAVTLVNESTEVLVISISIGATMLLILIALFLVGWRIRKKYYDNKQRQPYLPIGEGGIPPRGGEDGAGQVENSGSSHSEDGDGAGQVENSGSSHSGSTSASSKLTSTESQNQEEDSLQFPMERGSVNSKDQASDVANDGDAHVSLTQTTDRGPPKEDRPMNLAENLSVTIREGMLYVGKLTQTLDQTPQDNEGPEDQNLKCLKCGRVYKIGEIQYYRKHCKNCQGEL